MKGDLNEPIVLIGMSRSGTTVLSGLLSEMPGTHLETEPQLLWRMGNFRYLGDKYDLDSKVVAEIRRRLLKAAGAKRLIEKSPQNCLRPDLVHAVLPDARLVYLERDPVRCIRSHLQLAGEAASFSFTIRRYFGSIRWRRGAASSQRSAETDQIANSIFRQLRWQDTPAFVAYAARMLWNRYARRAAPFGVKLEGYPRLIRDRGLVSYHIAVFKKAQRLKHRFRQLYGDRMYAVALEELFASSHALDGLLRFCGYSLAPEELERLHWRFDRKRISKATGNTPLDFDIRRLLDEEDHVTAATSDV